jgi:hypothetical protein
MYDLEHLLSSTNLKAEFHPAKAGRSGSNWLCNPVSSTLHLLTSFPFTSLVKENCCIAASMGNSIQSPRFISLLFVFALSSLLFRTIELEREDGRICRFGG